MHSSTVPCQSPAKVSSSQTYAVDKRIDTWLETATALDLSYCGSGKSNDAMGDWINSAIAAGFIPVYVSNNHRNPTVSLNPLCRELPARHSGLSVAGTYRRRIKQGEAASIEANCWRADEFAESISKGCGADVVASELCRSCPVLKQCQLGVGSTNGQAHGYIFQRNEVIANAKAIISSPAAAMALPEIHPTPEKLRFFIDDVAINTSLIRLTSGDIEKGLGAVSRGIFSSKLKSFQHLLESVLSLLTKETIPTYGMGHTDVLQRLAGATETTLTTEQLELLQEIKSTSKIHYWLPGLLDAIHGDGSLRVDRHDGVALEIHLRNKGWEALAAKSAGAIHADATAQPSLIKSAYRMPGMPIIAVAQPPGASRHRLLIHGYGFSRTRSKKNATRQRRKQDVLTFIREGRGFNVAAIDFMENADLAAGEGYYGVHDRGSNFAADKQGVVLFGRFCHNIGVLLSTYRCYIDSAAEIDSLGFQRFLSEYMTAQRHQAWERARGNRKPGTLVYEVICCNIVNDDPLLDWATEIIHIDDLSPKKSIDNNQAVLDAYAALEDAGQKPTAKAIAAATGFSQRKVEAILASLFG